MDANFFDVNSVYTNNKNLQKKDVQVLIQWVKSQPHLPEINEAQAILFLCRWKYELEPAKTAIDSFFTVRTHYSDIFLHRNVSNLYFKQNMDICLYTMLPQKSCQGYSVCLVKILIPDPNRYVLRQLYKLFETILTLHLYQTGPSEGYIILLDAEDFTLELIARSDLAFMRQALYYSQKVSIAKLTQFHLINPPPHVGKLLAIISPFLEKEVADMLYVHPDITDLYEYVPQSVLPKDYGGFEESLAELHDKMIQKMVENVALFDWEDGQIVDENKRINDPTDVIDLWERGSIRNGKFEID